MESPLIILLVALLGGGGAAALVVAVRETLKWLRGLKTDEIDKAIAQWQAVSGAMVQQLREELARQEGSNERLMKQVDRQETQIMRLEKVNEDLKTENSRLDVLVRSLTAQNMDLGHKADVATQRIDELLIELGRKRGRDDAA